MANKKITELVEITAPDNADVVPLDDVSVPETKKVTVANLRALSSAAPENVTKASASAGVVNEAARRDHKHDVTTASAQSIGRANAEGTSSALARADHTHAVSQSSANVVSSPYTLLATDGTLVVDTAGERDIQLPAPGTLTGLIPVLIVDAGNNSEAKRIRLLRNGAELIDGVAANKDLKSDGGRWWLWTNGTSWFTAPCMPVTTSTPAPTARTGAVGTSEEPARADHVHDHGTDAVTVHTSGTLTLLKSHNYVVVSSASAITIDLPELSTLGGARAWRFLLAHDSPGAVTLNRFGAENLQGLASDYVMTGAWSSWTLLTDGASNWWLVQHYNDRKSIALTSD
ncbi:MAG: hypothetical protein K8H88_14420, partial [Sandaracinaceae bacterium]|nr:hypothetical protein [Sandaracinaceae bacterium]